MNSDSSSDEEYDPKLLASVDKSLLKDSLFLNDVSSENGECKLQPHSIREELKGDDQFTNSGISEGVKTFVSKQLSDYLEKKVIEKRFEKTDSKLEKAAGFSGGVHLFSNSTSYIDLEENASCTVKYKKLKLTKKETEDYREKCNSVAVSPEWVLSGSDSTTWSKQRKGARGKVIKLKADKKLKNGGLECRVVDE
ncbi:hypothetical protein LSTR_LSTR002475 [Laodelphax striatellus]|uniref:Protein CUSTOS n=1 Tax=Laodelphax striatellus TaxID=195883 RepID=A0A482X335_LAOST|nr:hypothetical protein LSTR_LSTR002475 [Laodelphax striatellus]